MYQKQIFNETKAEKEQEERLKKYYNKPEEVKEAEKASRFALILIVLFIVILFALLFNLHI
jgi:hypothetical protein